MPNQPTEDLLFALMDEQDRSYYVDPITGLVGVSATVRPLNYPPAGYEGQTIQWVRNLTFNGVITSMTAPFNFKRDGATILRHLYYGVKGIQSYAKLVIWIRNNDNQMQYLYVGLLNLSRAVDNQGAGDDEGFTCESVQEGLNELIAANRSTTYEMAVDVPEAIDVIMDGIIMYSEVRAINFADIQPGAGPGGGPGVVTRTQSLTNIGLVIPTTETQYPSLIWNSQTLYMGADNRGQIKDNWPNDWIFFAESIVNIPINIPHLRFVTATNLWRVGIWAVNEDLGTSRMIQLATGTTGGFIQEYDIPINDVVQLTPGEKAWFVYEMDVAGAGETVSFSHFPDFGDEDAFFSYDYRRAPTTVKWLTPMYVFSQLIDRITNGMYDAYSELLSGEISNFLLTSGDAVRGIDGAVVKISLDNFIKSYNVPFPLSLNTHEGRARIEREDYAYNNAIIADIGEALRFTARPSQDHLYNKFRFGWPNQEYNDVNGRFEFNTSSLYGTVITKMDKEYDGVSYIRADSIGMEIHRINLENKRTTDSATDDSVFMLDALYTGANTAIINRPDNIIITGIPNASTVFNIRLSPARCARAHGSKIRSALHLQENTLLKYLTKNKNVNIISTENGMVIDEKGDINILSLKQKLYLPIQIDLGVQTTDQIRNYLNENPGGQIVFTWYVSGSPVELRAFVMTASQEPVYLADQEFVLLLAGDIDQKKLIY